MNLLLFLSALMSALCAAGPSSHARVPQAVSQAVVAQQATRAVARTAISRPVQSLPTLTQLASAGTAQAPAIAPIALYASRRRE